MSTHKIKYEYRTILDFSGEKLNKTNIKKMLNSTEVVDVEIPLKRSREGYIKITEDNDLIYIRNEINVGMYKIRLLVSSRYQTKSGHSYKKDTHHLKEYGGFKIQIFQIGSRSIYEIDLDKDSKFRRNGWRKKNMQGELKSDDLTDIIMFCHRLHNLRAYS
jgi:hypothetical protein